VNQNRRKGTAVSVPTGIGMGVCLGLMLILAGSAVLAKLLDLEILDWRTAGYWIMGMLLVSSFVSATAAYRKTKRKRLQMCLLTGCVLWLVLMGITALFFGGQYDGIGVTGGLVLAGSGCAALVGARPQKRRKAIKIQGSRC